MSQPFYNLTAMLRNEISDFTRRDIIDELTLGGVNLFGRLGEVDFLSRVFDLTSLPSTDHRFDDMAGDLWQHRVNNSDWSDDWMWSDPRLNIRNGADQIFLQILAEMVHPIVRTSEGDRDRILEIVNRHLRSSVDAALHFVRAKRHFPMLCANEIPDACAHLWVNRREENAAGQPGERDVDTSEAGPLTPRGRVHRQGPRQ